MSTTVTYKGSTLTTVENQTKVLTTSGKYLEDNITLVDVTTGGSGSGVVWQDAQGYVHLDDEGTTPITVEPLSVTQNGTYTAPTGKAYSPVTVNVSGGGGGESASKKQINFIDYDGTIVESYTKTEWQSVTALPSNPSHTDLTAQGWNWTKAQIDAHLTAMPNDDVWIGQMYITDDGKTRIYIHLEEGRLHPYLGICPNGTVEVDWGDNSATATLTGTSLITVKHANHEYASGGDYIITLTASSGSFAFYGASNTSHILKKDATTTANVHKVYTNAVKKVELGSGASIRDYAFQNCYSLASITIPDSVTSIGNNVFQNCYGMAEYHIKPTTPPTLGTTVFNNIQSDCVIYVPSASLTAYQEATNWSTYASYMQGE